MRICKQKRNAIACERNMTKPQIKVTPAFPTPPASTRSRAPPWCFTYHAQSPCPLPSFYVRRVTIYIEGGSILLKGDRAASAAPRWLETKEYCLLFLQTNRLGARREKCAATLSDDLYRADEVVLYLYTDSSVREHGIPCSGDAGRGATIRRFWLGDRRDPAAPKSHHRAGA